MKTRRRMRYRRRARHSSGRRPRPWDRRSLLVEPLEVRALLDGVGILGGLAPTAVDDAYTGDEDTPLLVIAADGVLDNDTDPEDDPMTARVVAGPTDGTLSFQVDGSFRYTPDAHFNGTDSFTYVANDGESDSNVATVVLTINSVNDKPVAQDESFTTDEDVELYVPVGLSILNNDSDVDGDPITAVKATDPQNGTLNLLDDGSFYYLPDPDFNGTDSFTYTANDGSADSDPATVTITINSIEDAPVAVDDTYTVAENGTLTTTDVDGQGTPADPNDDGVLANDTDAEGDALTAQVVTGPSSGTLNFASDGTFTYTPNQFFNGTDTFTYQANDGDDLSNVATVTIDVGPVDNPPVTQPDFYTVAEDGTLTVLAGNGVLSNDFEPDGQPMEAILDTGPSNGQLTFQIDGSFEYTPDTDFVGTDTFTYIATDDTPNASPPTLVTITVANTNDAPDAIPDHYRINTNARLEVPPVRGVLVNDFDLDGDSLTGILDTGPSNARFFAFSSDGSFIYWPEPGFHGNDTFTYIANDGQADSTPDTVTIGVGGPIAADDEYFVDADTTLVVSIAEGVLANDEVLVGTSMTAAKVTDPSSGTLALAPDGSLVYVPDPGFVGEDSFLYVANDGVADSNPARVSITVGGPKAFDDAYQVDENEVLVVGPVNRPPDLPAYTFTPGNLLVVNTDEFGVTSLHEMMLDGTVVQSIELETTAGPARDFDIDSSGLIHFYTGGLPDPITDQELWSLLTLDTVTDTTVEHTYSFWNAGPQRHYGGAVTYGDYLFLTDYSDVFDPNPRGGMRVDLSNNFQVTRFGEYINAIDITLGQDGMLYVLYNRLIENPDHVEGELKEGVEIEVYDPDTLVLDRKIVPSTLLRGIAVDDRGNIYASTATFGLVQLDWQGVVQRQLIQDIGVLQSLVAYGELGDIDLAENGQIVASFVSRDGLQGGGALLVTDESFASYDILPVFFGPFPQDVTYAAFVPTPENAFEVTYNDVYDPNTVPQVEVVDQPDHGTLVFRPWGGFEYAPEAGFVGTDTFTYQFSDGTLNSNPATVTIDVQPTPLAPRAPFYFTVPEAAVLPGSLVVQNEDIVGFDGTDYFLVFDGSDVGLSETEISAFYFLSPHEILLSVYPAIDIPEMGENAGADDIVKFTATALGQTTAGRFDMYFDGSDVGLDPQLDNIDGLDLLPDGTILISPSRWTNPMGTMAFDEDVLSFFPVKLGRITAGNWEMYFDGSDVGMQFPTERIDALDVDRLGNIRFSTVDSLNVAGLVADDEDVFVFEPTMLGHDTAGTFRSELFFDGSAFGLAATDIDGMFIAVDNEAPALVGDTYVVNRNAVDEQHPYIVDGAGGVLSNDSDSPSDPMIAMLVEPTRFGGLVLGADGSFTYTPDDGFVGIDSFTYEVSDGLAVSETVVVTIEVVDPGIQPLGQSDLLVLGGQSPAGGDLWYSFATANAGLMTVEAFFAGAPDDVFVEIYDGINDLTPLVTSLPAAGGHRFEWPVDAAAESFLVRLSGVNPDVELRIANAVGQVLDVVTVTGGDGNDVFVFDLNQPDHVLVNGVSYDLTPGTFTSIVFEGGAGDDRLELTGTPDSETADVHPGFGTFDSTALDASFTDIEDVYVDGGGGIKDVASLYDTDGDDLYQAYPDHATLTGTSSAGVTYSFEVVDFDFVHGYALGGISRGRDRAEFYDSANRDDFMARADNQITWMQAVDSGTGEPYFNRSKFFEQNYAKSENGGDDVAQLRDSVRNEQVTASPTGGTMVGLTPDGAGFTFEAEGFRYWHAYGILGGYDTASMFGTTGNDNFRAIANVPVPYSLLTDDLTYYVRVKSMDAVVAFGNGGVDTALFKESPGNDVMVADASARSVTFAGPGHYSQVRDFANASALGLFYSGDVDRAYWSDSPGNDTFTGMPTLSTLVGPGYTFSAYTFQEVYLDASNGGSNVAEIHDSALADILEAEDRAGDTWARLSSNNASYDFLYELLAFDSVKAHTGPEDAVPDPLPVWLTLE